MADSDSDPTVVQDQDRHRRAAELFAASQAIPPHERADWLRSTCGSDDALRGEVEAMLLLPAAAAPRDRPEQIGPWHLLRPLGRGGMGQVFLAEQRDPVLHQVALKVIRQDRENEELLRRFDRERQVLASLQHPTIARFLQAGTTDDGQRWFAMEYVPGEPITTFCDRRRYALRPRLELLLRVCAGVRHAHSLAVIHRDLKPNNVLVFEQEGVATPKIIDFGLARTPEDPATTPLTSSAQMLGTLGYSSPEQLRHTVDPVDERADVWALGVLLAELVAGDGDGLPSNTLRATSRDLATAIATARKTTLPRLLRALTGDLDAIVRRATATRVQARYRTVGEFAEDLERHLRHQPVVAFGGGIGYRVRRFLRRQMLPLGLIGVGAAAAGFAMLLAGPSWSSPASTATAAEPLDVVADLEELVRQAANLQATQPTARTQIDSWLQRAAAASAAQAGIAAELQRLRADHERRPAIPTIDHRQALERAQRQLAALLHRQQGPHAPTTDEVDSTWTASHLNTEAYRRVAVSLDERDVFDEERRGLQLAFAALRAIDGQTAADARPKRWQVLDTLAWALLANGRSEDARTRIDEAVQCGATPRHSDRLKAASESLEVDLDAANRHVQAVQATIDASRPFVDATIAARAARLQVALADIDRLVAHQPRLLAQQRLAAEFDRLQTDPTHRELWQRASGPTPVPPQRGLLPIQPPRDDRWFFVDLYSHWDGASAADAIALPTTTGRREQPFAVGAQSGVIFALVRRDDSGASAPAPFFLACHELTRTQWRRLAGPDLEDPSRHTAELLAPVQEPDQERARRVLEAVGMRLPTVAEWRLAAGSPLPTLPTMAWLSPSAGTTPTAVGQLAANRFGLSDLCGNVREWTCTRGQGELADRVACVGGSFADPAAAIESEPVSWHPPKTSGGAFGIRPARDLDQ